MAAELLMQRRKEKQGSRRWKQAIRPKEQRGAYLFSLDNFRKLNFPKPFKRILNTER
jgi:hypothetical protein